MSSRLASRLHNRKNERRAQLRVTNSILKSKSYDYFADFPENAPASETDENAVNNMNSTASEATLDTSSSRQGVQSYLQTSDKTYEDKLRKLRKFKNKSKKDTKQKTLKNDWLKEWDHLEKAVVTTSGDTSNSLELLVIQDPSDVSMNGILEMMNVYYEGQNRVDQEYKEKVREMKDLLRETLRAIRCNGIEKKKVQFEDKEKDRETPVESEDKDKEVSLESKQPTNNTQAFAGIFADTMLSLRSSMSSQWMSLAEEEAALTAELNTAKRDIFNMIHNDRLDCQNTVMSKELRQMEGDDAETLLYIEEWYKRIESMDASHSESLQLLQTKREEEATKHFLITNDEKTNIDISEAVDSPESDIMSTTTALTHAGWSEGDHMTFVKVYKHQSFTMTDDAAHGNKRKTFIAQIMTHLPHRTREEILEHEAYYRSTRAILNQKKTLIQQYESSRAALLAEATLALEKFRADRAIDKECQAQLQAQAEVRMLLHQQLEALQKAKQERDELLRIEKEKMDLAQLKEQEWTDKVAKAEQEFRKAQVDIFKRMKEDTEAKQREQHEAAEAARAEEMKKLIALNKPKIEERERLRVLKEREKLAKEEEKQREEDRRTEMLMKLAATVPYYEDIMNAQSQLDHVTAAVKAHEYGGAEEQLRGFMKNTGFDDKKIIKDARFRLAAALRDAGVAESKMAKHVVQAFHPRPHLAIHGVLNRGAIL